MHCSGKKKTEWNKPLTVSQVSEPQWAFKFVHFAHFGQNQRAVEGFYLKWCFLTCFNGFEAGF